MDKTETKLGAIILAGGRGTRLPYKCFKMLGGKQLIIRVFEQISQVAQDIVIAVKTAQ